MDVTKQRSFLIIIYNVICYTPAFTYICGECRRGSKRDRDVDVCLRGMDAQLLRLAVSHGRTLARFALVVLHYLLFALQCHRELQRTEDRLKRGTQRWMLESPFLLIPWQRSLRVVAFY